MTQDKYCNKHHKAGCKCGRHRYVGIDEAIIDAMQSVYQKEGTIRVFPSELLVYLDKSYLCTPQTLRVHMNQLANEGKLIRFGKNSGYELLPEKRQWCNRHRKFECECQVNRYQEIESAIVNAMKKALVEDGRVQLFPHDLLIYIEDTFFCHHATLRRYMAKLADAGRLIRVGDRQGYQLKLI